MKYVEVKRANQTLDEIVYNYYGSSFNFLEAVLRVNPSLAEQPLILPKGYGFYLPEVAESNNSERISLWS